MFRVHGFQKQQTPAGEENKQHFASHRSAAATAPVLAKLAKAGCTKPTKRACCPSDVFRHRQHPIKRREEDAAAAAYLVSAGYTSQTLRARSPGNLFSHKQDNHPNKRREEDAAAAAYLVSAGYTKPTKRARSPDDLFRHRQEKHLKKRRKEDAAAAAYLMSARYTNQTKRARSPSDVFSHKQDSHPNKRRKEDRKQTETTEQQKLGQLSQQDVIEQFKAKLEDVHQSGICTTTTKHMGFPNIGQSCYMNSTLQSLLSLGSFTSDLSCSQQVWNSVPNARLIRRFMAIKNAHSSPDSRSKRHLLRSFKEVVSVQAPEFSDDQQKDAHEFLITVLDQMRTLSPILQEAAAHNASKYTCPVEDQMVFCMENTRTCKSCGVQSKREEVFTNLSLDLVPGGTVEDLLHKYTKETELDYRCECGGGKSGLTSTFKTLPNVLVLHLKRFRYTPTYQRVKVHDPIVLLRDILVTSQQDGACYSLASVISHLGVSGEGHYICDRVHPDSRPDETTDRWLCFNDSAVTEGTGKSVCSQRETSAYVLLYQRQE